VLESGLRYDAILVCQMIDLDYADFRLVSLTSTPGDMLSGARLKDRCRELV
jgi:hypothetical protein